MKWTVRGAALLGALVTLSAQFYPSGFPSPRDLNPFLILIMLWGLFPFLIMFLTSFRFPPGHRGLPFLAATDLLAVGATGYILWDAFVAHPDAQGGLLFLFLPLWQTAAILVLYGLSRLVGRSAKA